MKLGWSKSGKKIESSFEVDAERIAEKAMDLHEKDWKDKFVTKHKAKKDMLDIMHKQRVEMENVTKTKKNYIQKIIGENRLNKELELKYEKELEEAKIQERYKEKKLKIVLTIILGVMTMLFVIIGAFLGNNADPSLYLISFFGFIILVPIISIWKTKDDSNNKR